MKLKILSDVPRKYIKKDIDRVMKSTPLGTIFTEIDYERLDRVAGLMESARLVGGRWDGMIDANKLLESYRPRKRRLDVLVTTEEIVGDHGPRRVRVRNYELYGIGYEGRAVIHHTKRNFPYLFVHEVMHSLGVFEHCRNRCAMNDKVNTLRLCRKHLGKISGI